jgi:hypothetical protein
MRKRAQAPAAHRLLRAPKFDKKTFGENFTSIKMVGFN